MCDFGTSIIGIDLPTTNAAGQVGCIASTATSLRQPLIVTVSLTAISASGSKEPLVQRAGAGVTFPTVPLPTFSEAKTVVDRGNQEGSTQQTVPAGKTTTIHTTGSVAVGERAQTVTVIKTTSAESTTKATKTKATKTTKTAKTRPTTKPTTQPVTSSATPASTPSSPAQSSPTAPSVSSPAPVTSSASVTPSSPSVSIPVATGSASRTSRLGWSLIGMMVFAAFLL